MACRAAGRGPRSWDLSPTAAVPATSSVSAPGQLGSGPGPSPCSVLPPSLDSSEAPPGSEPQFPYLSLRPTPVLQAVGGCEPVKEAQGSAWGPPVPQGQWRPGRARRPRAAAACTSGSRVRQAAGVGATAALTQVPGADHPRPGTWPVNRRVQRWPFPPPFTQSGKHSRSRVCPGDPGVMIVNALANSATSSARGQSELSLQG